MDFIIVMYSQVHIHVNKLFSSSHMSSYYSSPVFRKMKYLCSCIHSDIYILTSLFILFTMNESLVSMNITLCLTCMSAHVKGTHTQYYIYS
jgi:hypothetical protein